MNEDGPFCRLGPADMGDRRAAWGRILEQAAERSYIATGTRFTFPPAVGLTDRLRDLARSEAECCPWMGLDVTEAPSGRITLNISASDRGAIAAIQAMFDPAVSLW